MTLSAEHRTGWHADYLHMERNDMNNHSTEIASWLRAGIVGIAFSLATVQAAGADALRPTVDAGGSGSAASQPSAAYAPMPEQPESVVASASEVAQEDPYYAIAHEHGNGTFTEHATGEIDPAAEARRAIAANENLRSILMIEGKEVANDVAAPAFAVHPNLRSIQIIEGKEVANSEAVPAFAVHPNLRSILIVEGNQAVAEVARPASLSAYAICLACSTLG
ncbi:MAG: hypothetical protein H0U38_08655 [Chloroflexia bacterium]|nr:hypothetical protein [Chloroflexia bacterium]